jgi:hypothetical protein
MRALAAQCIDACPDELGSNILRHCLKRLVESGARARGLSLPLALAHNVICATARPAATAGSTRQPST